MKTIDPTTLSSLELGNILHSSGWEISEITSPTRTVWIRLPNHKCLVGTNRDGIHINWVHGIICFQFTSDEILALPE